MLGIGLSEPLSGSQRSTPAQGNEEDVGCRKAQNEEKAQLGLRFCDGFVDPPLDGCDVLGRG